jgi:hypothetical protein
MMRPARAGKPDGYLLGSYRIATAPEPPRVRQRDRPGLRHEGGQGRAADVSFVLDQLPSKWDGSDLIDGSQIAMVGPSIGGASAMAAMLEDSRARAGITTWTAPCTPGSPRTDSPGRSCSWVRRSTRPEAAATIRGTATGSCRPGGSAGWCWPARNTSLHRSPLLAGALGIEPAYGVLPAARSIELTRTYVAASLDHHLQGERQPLLHKPSPRQSEVEFCPATCG